MTRKITLSVAVATSLAVAAPLLGCPSKEKSVSESAKDALDMREHEELKDTGEDVKDAVNDAGEEAKEEID